MKMFEKIGEFIPDSLIASADFPILKEGIGLKAGQGILKRGSLIMRGTDKAGYIAGKGMATQEEESAADSGTEMKIFGILTDDTDTGNDGTADNIPAVCYQTGIFARDAILVSGENGTIDTYEDEMRGKSLFLRNVQNY